MAIFSPDVLLEAFEASRPHFERLLPKEISDEFFNLVKEKRAEDKPSITVYGIYSHGKSSLINALLGEDAAEVSEEPKTAWPQDYKWRGYIITDTPGIDAPIEHGKLAEEKLNKSEVVLFVIDSSSTDLQRVQEKMASMVKNGQYVCLIINDRDNLLGEENAANCNAIRDKFDKILQQLGILEDVPTLFVNAKTALKAKKEQKNQLLKFSGIGDLERKLEIFFQDLPAGQKWLILHKKFSDIVDSLKIDITERTNDPRLAEAQKSLQRIEQTEKELRSDIAEELNNRLVSLKNQIRSDLHAVQKSEELQHVLSPRIQSFGNSMGEYCQRRLSDAGKEVTNICLTFDEFSNSLRADALGSTISRPDIVNTISNLPWKALLGNLNWENLVKEGTVKILQSAKELLPSLFKGIGAKTMASWATVLSKWLGPIGLLLSSIYDYYQKDKAESEAWEAAQRKAQVLQEAADSIVENLRESFNQQLNPIIDQIFASLKEQIQKEIDKLLTAHEEAKHSLEELARIQARVTDMF